MRSFVVVVAAAALLLAAGCSSSSSGAPPPSSAPAPTTSHRAVPTITLPPLTSSAAPSSKTHAPHTSSAPPVTSSAPPRTSSAPPQPPANGAPVIVIDPGHSPTVHGTDPATGLDLTDYENEPEMRDMFAVALLVKAALERRGYRVLLTKKTADTPANLGVRAYLANDAHAALALSIHDQAGANGGLPFSSSNNHVYYQAVGDYRRNPEGRNIYFTDSALAATSKRYGQIFAQQRQAVEHHSVNLMSNTGYDLGGRGLQAGDIWIVQLLSKVPWIYNEAGGNSAGTVGLNGHDKQTYADGLVASVERCIAPPR